MKSLVLAALTALTIAFSGLAAADMDKEYKGAFPEGSLQTSAE